MGLFDGTPLERPVLCARCGEDAKLCVCPQLDPQATEQDVQPSAQKLKLRIEKRKRGKVVTLVTQLRGPAPQRQALLTLLKNQLGTGGTMVDDDLELQGSHLERLKPLLEQLGYRVQ